MLNYTYKQEIENRFLGPSTDENTKRELFIKFAGKELHNRSINRKCIEACELTIREMLDTYLPKVSSSAVHPSLERTRLQEAQNARKTFLSALSSYFYARTYAVAKSKNIQDEYSVLEEYLNSFIPA